MTSADRVAVVGTGLIRTSVAMAAGRVGDAVRGFDTDADALARAAERSGLTPSGTLEECVAGATVVVVSTPIPAARRRGRGASIGAGRGRHRCGQREVARRVRAPRGRGCRRPVPLRRRPPDGRIGALGARSRVCIRPRRHRVGARRRRRRAGARARGGVRREDRCPAGPSRRRAARPARRDGQPPCRSPRPRSWSRRPRRRANPSCCSRRGFRDLTRLAASSAPVERHPRRERRRDQARDLPVRGAAHSAPRDGRGRRRRRGRAGVRRGEGRACRLRPSRR